jgi:hypothetical protein
VKPVEHLETRKSKGRINNLETNNKNKNITDL